jgi:hypothetical protein
LLTEGPVAHTRAVLGEVVDGVAEHRPPELVAWPGGSRTGERSAECRKNLV